jgi:hypothetical protein
VPTLRALMIGAWIPVDVGGDQLDDWRAER